MSRSAWGIYLGRLLDQLTGANYEEGIQKHRGWAGSICPEQKECEDLKAPGSQKGRRRAPDLYPEGSNPALQGRGGVGCGFGQFQTSGESDLGWTAPRRAPVTLLPVAAAPTCGGMT